MDSWVVSAEDLVEEQRTDPSLAWLVPQQGFWSDEEVSTKLPLLSNFLFHLFPFFFTSFSPSLSHHQSQISWQSSNTQTGSCANPKEELHCCQSLRILLGLWWTKLCYDGRGMFEQISSFSFFVFLQNNVFLGHKRFAARVATSRGWSILCPWESGW